MTPRSWRKPGFGAVIQQHSTGRCSYGWQRCKTAETSASNGHVADSELISQALGAGVHCGPSAVALTAKSIRRTPGDQQVL
jgi:hypothetical protein